MTVTIELDEVRTVLLERLAAKAGLTLSEYVEQTMIHLADAPPPPGPVKTFEQATKYILAKNAELYRRLAK